jgi:uncharacterized protein (TIGR03435 family)
MGTELWGLNEHVQTNAVGSCSGCGDCRSCVASRAVRGALKFEAAAIRPSLPDTRPSGGCRGADLLSTTDPLGRCILRHATLRTLIQRAYPLDLAAVTLVQQRVLGGPSWIDDSFYDIEAKAENESDTTTEQRREMLRTLLKDRFQLAIHTETRETNGYQLLEAKGGFRLKEATAPATPADVATARRRSGGLPFFANNTTLADYGALLSMFVKAPIIDKTGIPGKYNIFLYSAETGDATAGSVFSALQEQLGLRLEAEKIQYEVHVIDRAERPSEIDR